MTGLEVFEFERSRTCWSVLVVSLDWNNVLLCCCFRPRGLPPRHWLYCSIVANVLLHFIVLNCM